MRKTFFFPYFDTPGDGGSGGGNITPSTTGGDTGAAGSAGAGGSVHRFTDDQMVDFGDGQPIRWADRQTRYMDRSAYDRGHAFLVGEAQRLQQLQNQMSQQTGRPQPQAPRQAPTDPLAEVRGMTTIDGRAMGQVVDHLYQAGLAPIAQAVAQMAAKITALEKGHQTVAQTAGSLNESRIAGDFEDAISKGISLVNPTIAKGLPEGVALDPKNPFLRELAKDVYMSHENWRAGDLEKMIGERVSGAFALVTSLLKQAQATATERKKQFFVNPTRGAATPTGQSKYQFQKGDALASALFSATDGAT